jgi:hypothetical protein
MKHYVHVAAGSGSKPGELVPDHARRADYIVLPNGDALGVIEHPRGPCRQKLEAMPGVTVMQSHERPAPLPAAHVQLLAHAGVVAGDTMWDAAMKLQEHHQMPWFDPEFYHDYF